MTVIPMNIVYLCANPGLDLDNMLGPKIHIQAILRGLKTKHVNPILIAVQKSDSVQNYAEFETVILPHRYLRGFVHRLIPPIGIIDSLRVCWTILKLNRTKKFALIHERYTGLSWGGLWAAKLLRKPYLLEMVGPGIEEKAIQLTPLKPFKRWLAILHQKIVIANSYHLILNSNLIAKFIFQQRGWKLPHHTVILNGASIPEPLSDEEKQSIRRQYVAEKRILLLYSGSLYRWYGIFELIKAFQLVLKIHPEIKFLIIGQGEARDELVQTIRRNRLEDSILLMNIQPHRQLQKIIQAADYCLVYYPGEQSYFGSSTKCIEYMAAGKPVIATPHMSEIIDDGKTGFLAKSADIRDYSAKINSIIQQPELARVVGENARHKIENHYLWQHYIAKLLHIYHQVTKC